MFSPDIVASDAFLEMPTSSRELYFQLGMYADDDGFVSPRKIMRMIGASDDDLKVLIGKRFLLVFETGVVVIKHWLIHNLIRADLYKETLYKSEKATLGLKDNGSYTELREGVSELKVIEAPKWLQLRRKEKRTANVPQTALRLGKDRLGKDRDTYSSIDYLKQIPEADIKEFTERFDASAGAIKSKAEDLLNYCKSKGKTYKDYRAFLLNALKKDFRPRPKQSTEIVEVIDPITRSMDIEKTRKAREEISAMLANRFKI